MVNLQVLTRFRKRTRVALRSYQLYSLQSWQSDVAPRRCGRSGGVFEPRSAEAQPRPAPPHAAANDPSNCGREMKINERRDWVGRVPPLAATWSSHNKWAATRGQDITEEPRELMLFFGRAAGGGVMPASGDKSPWAQITRALMYGARPSPCDR